MNILMMTNTYTPIVGGVEKSIGTFSEKLREKGHEVIIAAPEYEDMPKAEKKVIRLPAIQKFNGTDFSVNLPLPGRLSKIIHDYGPDIIHSHHPFLMGDLALRMARQYEIPLVFTYHTMFEQYLHYLPVHNEKIKRFVIELSCGYANLTDQVIVPTQSVFDVLKKRGVKTPIEIIPTSIDTGAFLKGNGANAGKSLKIPEGAYVIGHVGRLEREKNLGFLSKVIAKFLQKNENVHCLIVGEGNLKEDIKDVFAEHGAEGRVHFSGILKGRDLIDACRRMDVFVFSSHSETQGMVLVEAMAAGLPVIAVDAPGARDIIRDFVNGRLIETDDESKFLDALSRHFYLNEAEKRQITNNARNTVKAYAHDNCVEKLLRVYKTIKTGKKTDQTVWARIMNRIKAEWDLLKNIGEASETALRDNAK